MLICLDSSPRKPGTWTSDSARAARRLGIEKAARRRIEEASETNVLASLRLLAGEQLRIGTGAVKGATPAQKTASAKAYAELSTLITQLEQSREHKTDSLMNLDYGRRDLIRAVLRAPDELMVTSRQVVYEAERVILA